VHLAQADGPSRENFQQEIIRVSQRQMKKTYVCNLRGSEEYAKVAP
jgi:hypothetical protein